jgi:hypothetical protein
MRGFISPVFGQNGPTLVISPFAANLKVTSGVTLFDKPAVTCQRNRSSIGWLDVCLKPVKLELFKGVPEHQAHALAHQSLLLKIGECIITKEATAKMADDNIVDIDYSN